MAAGFKDRLAKVSKTEFFLCPATLTSCPEISPVVSKTAICTSSPVPRPLTLLYSDCLGAASNKSANLQRLVIKELSGIIVYNPPE